MKTSLKTLGLTLAVAASTIAFAPTNASAKNPKEKPAITMKQARAAAMQAIPNGKIKSAELKHEDGQFIYSFDISVNGGIKEVWVDAKSGKVTKTEDETPAHEKNEAASEKPKHKTSKP